MTLMDININIMHYIIYSKSIRASLILKLMKDLFTMKFKYGRSRLFLPTLLLQPLCSITIFANEISELSTEADLFSDFSVTSVARLAQSPRDLPVSSTIISSEMIRASGATEIPDLFRLVPGFRVAMPDGGIYSVIAAGAGDQWGRTLEVQINGLPVHSPVLNFVDWLALPIEIDDVEYIEIMRGTSAAFYGANAFDGVINIITKKPFEDKGVYVRKLTGDPGADSLEIKTGFQIGDSSHSLAWYFKESEGFDDLNDSYEYTKIRYSVDFSITKNDEIEFMYDLNNGFKGEQNVGGILPERTRDIDTARQYIKWTHRYQDGDSLILKTYHHYVGYDDLFETDLLSELLNVSPAVVPLLTGHADQTIKAGIYIGESDKYGIDIQQSFTLDTVKFIIGAGFIYDYIESKYLFGDEMTRSGSTKQLFSNMEWQINDSYVLNAGAMIEQASERDAYASPRLALSYHLNNNNTFRVAAALSVSPESVYYSGLNLVALYTDDGDVFDRIVDARDEVEPEKLISYEIAHIINYPSYNITLDWRLYHNQYQNTSITVRDLTIVDDLGDGSLVKKNGGDYTSNGFELQSTYTFNTLDFLNFHFAYTDTEGSILRKQNPDRFKDYSNVTPSTNYGILINKNIVKGINFGINYTHVDEVEWLSAGDTVPEYNRLDLSLSSELKLGKTLVKFDVIAQNVLDDYIEFNDNNVFDTRLLFRLSLKYL